MPQKYELIITEKPSAAQKIAEALADGKALKKNEKGVPYYLVTHGKNDIVVACAAGHLYTIAEKDKQKWTYPIFNVEWVPTSESDKGAAYLSRYLSTIKKLSKEADRFTIATDFDIEGEVIGLNILRYSCKQKDGNRMKFSTLTKDELVESYEKKSKTIDWGQANAGIVRHELDWYYGINLSRALTLAIKSAGRFKIMSSGRVQGPALKIVVDKEREIGAFISTPYWQLVLHGTVKNADIEAWHEKDRFLDKNEASVVLSKVNGKDGTIKNVERAETKQFAPHPFDLTSLQIEAYKVLGMKPNMTLDLAQDLYIGGFISYPRTSSQQLPHSIGFHKILKALSNNNIYADLASMLLEVKNLVPNNGKKTDPAHPAIFPTGNIPNMDERHLRLYDLIVKRFMATFASDAIRETMTVSIDVASELFIAKGTRTKVRGWHVFYDPYVMLDDVELPAVGIGDHVAVKDIQLLDKETQPPRRYTQASIIKELEKKNLGTKATRAAVVQTLIDRGYVVDDPITATAFGIKTINTLEKYCPSIIDDALTEHFESEMDEIREGTKKNDEVLEEAKQVLTEILKTFKKSEKDIGENLLDAQKETETEQSTIGACKECGVGTLMMRRGKFGRFVACDKYPDCKVTFKLPVMGLIKPTDDKCKVCGHPEILIIRKGKRPQTVCLNTDCPSKKSEDKAAQKEADAIGAGTIEKPCPKCKEGKLVLRKSVYGQFYGCSRFPKCRHIEKVGGNNNKKSNYNKKE